MMKQRFLCASGILLALLFSVDGRQVDRQKPSFEYEKECGDPTMESMAWRLIKGTIVRIIDGDSLELLTEDGDKRIVNLVAIDASSEKSEASSLWSSWLLVDRKVNVLVNPSHSSDHTLVGIVESSGTGTDINRELLAAGAAQYKTPAAYSMSGYKRCVYSIVEKNAREAKKGIWQRANP